MILRPCSEIMSFYPQLARLGRGSFHGRNAAFLFQNVLLPPFVHLKLIITTCCMSFLSLWPPVLCHLVLAERQMGKPHFPSREGRGAACYGAAPPVSHGAIFSCLENSPEGWGASVSSYSSPQIIQNRTYS